MSLDEYMVVWCPWIGKYVVRHVNLKHGREIRWEKRETDDYEAFRAARYDGEGRPDVIMGTFVGYAAATKAIGEYPSLGAYA